MVSMSPVLREGRRRHRVPADQCASGPRRGRGCWLLFTTFAVVLDRLVKELLFAAGQNEDGDGSTIAASQVQHHQTAEVDVTERTDEEQREQHQPTVQESNEDATSSPLVCSLPVGDLAPEWFQNFGNWQTRYGRDNLSLSKHFYEEMFLGKFLAANSDEDSDLQGRETAADARKTTSPQQELLFPDAVRRCPAATLEIMMNGVLHVDTHYGREAAKRYVQYIFDLRDAIMERLDGTSSSGAFPFSSTSAVVVDADGVDHPQMNEKPSVPTVTREHEIGLLPWPQIPHLMSEVAALERRDPELLSTGDKQYQLRNLKILMQEWEVDIAFVYPKVFNVHGERLGPFAPRTRTTAWNRGANVDNELQSSSTTNSSTENYKRASKSPASSLNHGTEPHQSGDDESETASTLCHGQRFFVYDDLHFSLYTPGLLSCLQGQWGTEVLVRSFFENSSCRTYDEEAADWFYVGLFATCRYVKLNEGVVDEGKVMKSMDQLSTDYIWEAVLAYLRTSKYYHRHNGQDHIFLFADGQGPRIFDSYDVWRAEAVFLSPEATCPTWGENMRKYVDVKRCLGPWKDVIIPGHTDYARLEYMKKHDKPSQDRQLLATFHGRAPGGHTAYEHCAVRRKVMDLSGFPGVDVGGFVSDYLERKGDSHFCLVPAGTSPWTNHLYESFYSGCVPVILSDDYFVAFRHEIPWEKIAIKWPESLVDSRLYQFLHDLAVYEPGRLREMKQNGRKYSCFFNWYSVDVKCNPYLLILRRLKLLRDRRREDREWTVDMLEEGTINRENAEEMNSRNRETNADRRYWNYEERVVQKGLRELADDLPRDAESAAPEFGTKNAGSPAPTSSSENGSTPIAPHLWDPAESLDPALLQGLRSVSLEATQRPRVFASAKVNEDQHHEDETRDLIDFAHLFRPTRFKNFVQEATNFTWYYSKEDLEV
ncbi:unnamed protein product [Amoebophrya sp. A120]|nr:unnamed protein product [Amoebophrya sp. A120]|eukprot:GSA120T00001040001.1